MMIDAKGKLKPTHFAELKNKYSIDTSVDCMLVNAQATMTFKLGDIRNFFTDNSVRDIITNDETIDLVIGDDALEFGAGDYFWWSETDRLNKLLDEHSETSTPKPRARKDETIYNVACGIWNETDGKTTITEIEAFTGNRNDVIEHINKYYTRQLLKSHFEANIKFCFYTEDDELKNFENWKTLDELASEGKVTLA